MINAWRDDDRLMSDLGEVHGKPFMVRCGDELFVSEPMGAVTMVSRDWFDELPDDSVNATRDGDVLIIRFDHVGGVGRDADGYTTVDNSAPPGEWRYRVLPDPVYWSDLGEDAPHLALAVLA